MEHQASGAVFKNLDSNCHAFCSGLGNAELTPPKTAGGAASGGAGGANAAGASKSNTILYGDSEELNRVVVLTLARSIHVSGLEPQSAPWVKETLNNIMQKTPHSWPSHTLQNFPPILQEFFKENPGPKEDKNQLSQKVEEEYKTWTSMTNEQDRIQHFSSANNSLFLCVIWKMVLETDHISPVAYKVGAGNNLRLFSDTELFARRAFFSLSLFYFLPINS